MKGRLSYKRPEAMTYRELKDEIKSLTSDINQAIMQTSKISGALKKEIKFLQVLRSGKEQKYDVLRYWFKGKKKKNLIEEYKELVRFSRFDRFTEKAQQREDDIARKAYDKFTHNRANLPGEKIKFEEFLDLRNFFGNVTKDLIENFGYNEIMDVYNEVSDYIDQEIVDESEELGDLEEVKQKKIELSRKVKKKDLVMEMHRINKDYPSLSPADKLIELKRRLKLTV